MGRRIGGLALCSPFGLPEYHRGDYTGTIEALNAVSTYIHDINAKYIIMMHGNTAANIDLRAAIGRHLASGAEITAICTDATRLSAQPVCVDADGFARSMIFNQTAAGEGAASLEAYIISKQLLISMMDACAAANHYHFHRDAIADYLASGGKVNVFFHGGLHGKRIMSTELFNANMDMLSAANRADCSRRSAPCAQKRTRMSAPITPRARRRKTASLPSRCIIEGEIDNCIISSDVRIRKGTQLSGCVIMRGTEIGEGVKNVIADKSSTVSSFQTKMGSEKLPVMLPKGTKI